MRTYRIAFTGGGSGGHTVPLLAVALDVKRLAGAKIQLQLHYIGPKKDLSTFVSEGLTTHAVLGAKIRRYFSLENILDIPKFFISLVQALWHLYWIMPDCIFSKGGAGALPTVMAGWIYRIPIIIHESDSTPGVTNLISSWLASRIATSFQSANKYFPALKTTCVGNPIRRDLIDYPISQKDAKERLGFNPDEPLVFVSTGSQGSVRINEFILSLLPDLLKDAQVLHQVGKTNYAQMAEQSAEIVKNIPVSLELKHGYKIEPFLTTEDMKFALTAADLIVGRAGSSIFEIAAFGKPAILIPLAESANDHQRKNAYVFQDAGAGLVLEESNLLPRIFLRQLETILKDSELRNRMGSASASFFKPNASEVIAQEVLRLAGVNFTVV